MRYSERSWNNTQTAPLSGCCRAVAVAHRTTNQLHRSAGGIGSPRGPHRCAWVVRPLGHATPMTTRPTRITALVAGGVVLTIVHFVFYDPVDKSPTFLRPGLLIYDGVVLFLAINLFAFAVNIF